MKDRQSCISVFVAYPTIRRSFNNRDDVKAPIKLYGQFRNIAFWEGRSFGDQLWKPTVLQKRVASNQNWIDLDEGEGLEVSTMDVINE